MAQIKKLKGLGRLLVGVQFLVGGAGMSAWSDSTLATIPRLEGWAQSSVTVSGISSGAFMAVQLQVAHSATFSGVGSVAGGIYWCAEGVPAAAMGLCMVNPALIQVGTRVEKAIEAAREGLIDPVDNLRDAKVYLYASPVDTVINAVSSYKLARFYEEFVDRGRIAFRNDYATAHGFPTLDFGAFCGMGGFPWVLNCAFDLAGEMLSELYGRLRDPARQNVEPDERNLYAFDQTPFTDPESHMSSVGHVYVPTDCKRGQASCRLHVALHGCGMIPAYVGDSFYAHAGYNRWAEANNIVVLYPEMAPSFFNQPACWDWIGTTGSDYVLKSAPQIRSIKAMVDRLTGRS